MTELETLRAEIDRMRPVCEAAVDLLKTKEIPENYERHELEHAVKAWKEAGE